MPNCGDDGLMIATRDDGARVEFRGVPYHLWTAEEDTPFSRLHGALERVNVSALHADEVETVTPWHPEWPVVSAMVSEALETWRICPSASSHLPKFGFRQECQGRLTLRDFLEAR
jgi:hypothetical protein